jgi:hypothetical protein
MAPRRATPIGSTPTPPIRRYSPTSRVGLLDQAPAMPSGDELDALADHIDDVLERGTPAQRKALIEQLVHEIQIVGPSRIRPIYRIPRRNQDTEPGADDCRA